VFRARVCVCVCVCVYRSGIPGTGGVALIGFSFLDCVAVSSCLIEMFPCCSLIFVHVLQGKFSNAYASPSCTVSAMRRDQRLLALSCDS
jgi:hypothetical protein